MDKVKNDMKEQKNLTTGNIGKTMILFAMPYLLACFMQTFYGMADLFVVGIYCRAETTTAVSVGSQVMHMLTVVIVGLAMGTTVMIGRAVGGKKPALVRKVVGTTVALFGMLAVVFTVILLIFAGDITRVMMTPPEAVSETRIYLTVCFAGIPFIVAYNVISSIFRGLGDSRHPMYFVGIACVSNIILDYIFIGGFGLKAAGAALGTVCGQAVSVLSAVILIKKNSMGLFLGRKEIRIHKKVLREVVKVGVPVAMQDGLIQVAFIIITVIANRRGVIVASSVGIVEKIISFMFLVPSAFLSAISAVTAQNMGAEKVERARKSLYYGLGITLSWGILCFVYSQFLPKTLVGLFSRNTGVVTGGCEYLRAYSMDCIFAAVHFCFSGYFCGDQKSMVSFVHNMISILFVRIPGAYLASVWYPDSLYPMGMAAPAGSLLSALICVGVYCYYRRILHLSSKKTDT